MTVRLAAARPRSAPLPCDHTSLQLVVYFMDSEFKPLSPAPSAVSFQPEGKEAGKIALTSTTEFRDSRRRSVAEVVDEGGAEVGDLQEAGDLGGRLVDSKRTHHAEAGCAFQRADEPAVPIEEVGP